MGKRKISKRVREEAAMLCSIAACNEWRDGNEGSEIAFADSIAESPPRDTPAGHLAWAAEKVAYSAWRVRHDWTPDTHWAEAESMIRTGWTPNGDEP